MLQCKLLGCPLCAAFQQKNRLTPNYSEFKMISTYEARRTAKALGALRLLTLEAACIPTVYAICKRDRTILQFRSAQPGRRPLKRTPGRIDRVGHGDLARFLETFQFFALLGARHQLDGDVGL